MNRLALILIAATALSCDSGAEKEADRNSLLISTKWTHPAGDILTAIRDFNNDGSYLETYLDEKSGGKITIEGTWKWISETEVSLLHTSMTINGETYNFNKDGRDRYILRITEITKERLMGITRHSGDLEDSGFANHVIFNAAKK